MILALAGGVGGAKLARGLADILAPGSLTMVVNTGDDFEHLGLAISPDIDTVTYNLADLNNPDLGWGLKDESWNCMVALERLGAETWFRLGDRDLATHLERTRRLMSESLSGVTADFCKRLGIGHRVLPMSDDLVRTMVETDRGVLAFQDYFVRLQCTPVVKSLRFDGLETARPHPDFLAALTAPELEAIIVCPSNPFLSILPILSLKGVREALRDRTAPLVAVSPIIAGQAVKGPAAKIMTELGLDVSAAGVAGFYGEILDGLVLDEADRALAPAIGRPAMVTATMMRSLADKRRLAAETIEFARGLKGRGA